MKSQSPSVLARKVQWQRNPYLLTNEKLTWIQALSGTMSSDGSASQRRMRPKSSINLGMTPAASSAWKTEWKFSMELIAGFIRATPATRIGPMIHSPAHYCNNESMPQVYVDTILQLKLPWWEPEVSLTSWEKSRLSQYNSQSQNHLSNWKLHKCFCSRADSRGYRLWLGSALQPVYNGWAYWLWSTLWLFNWMTK